MKAGHFRKPDARTPEARKNKRATKKPKLSIEQRAELLAALPPGEIPPFMVDDGAFDSALVVWRDLSPGLKRLNALTHADRYAFALYCVHVSNWIEAETAIRNNGAIYKARNTVNGDELQKLSPWVRVREISERHILEIGSRFGLDPFNRFKLLQLEALVPAGMLPGLFDANAEQQTKGDDDKGATGMLARHSSSPPRPN